MRPDLLRFQLMQAMQQQQQAQQQNPQMPGAQPTPQQMHPVLPSLPPRNPIGEGAANGIEAARRSIQMNKAENSRALGRAMMHFFSGKNLPPPGSGLAGALGSINSSFLPAMQQYDAERDRIAQENYTLMRHEEEMRRHAAKEAEDRARFEEMKRLHDAQIEHYGALNQHYKSHDDYRAQKLAEENSSAESSTPVAGFDLAEYPEIKTTKERNDYAAVLRGSSLAFRALSNIKKDVNKLEKITGDNIFAPTGSIVPGINTVKDVAARVGNATFPDSKFVKSLNEESVLRKRLESEFARLEPVLERGLKGSAAGEQLLKRFHNLGVYFNSGQPMNAIKDRLDELMKEVEETIKLAKWSLRTGRHIDALPIDSRENPEEFSESLFEESPQERISAISIVKRVNPGISDAAIVEAQRRLQNGQ